MQFDVLLLVVGQLDKKQQQQQESVSSVSLQEKAQGKNAFYHHSLWIQNFIWNI